MQREDELQCNTACLYKLLMHLILYFMLTYMHAFLFYASLEKVVILELVVVIKINERSFTLMHCSLPISCS